MVTLKRILWCDCNCSCECTRGYFSENFGWVTLCLHGKDSWTLEHSRALQSDKRFCVSHLYLQPYAFSWRAIGNCLVTCLQFEVTLQSIDCFMRRSKCKYVTGDFKIRRNTSSQIAFLFGLYKNFVLVMIPETSTLRPESSSFASVNWSYAWNT